ncbi:hypothetical protein ACFVYA_11120 [Amycolatopsis sp. NPDC058278]|jgi:hypothetical protein|uniref:hypothetical protein n=1 Tax=unclassified Amycolatopsis TaxID=2618356 RepID=UPI00255BB319|nr:hypothetical protein [Amycolatopsis sp. DG1A-15b]WIX89085.1 hypothetical protein QRY02_01130 [Amycolatopsis sp. DG1A-15b]
MRIRTTLLAAAAIAGVAVISGTAAITSAATADDAPPGLVEDYSYPGADKILRDRGITLVSGDGHILLVDCAGHTGVIEVYSTNNPADHAADPGHYCFQVTGSTGDLKLSIPYAFQAKGDDQEAHNVQATVTIKGAPSTVNVDKHGWTGFGEGAGQDPATLVELKVTGS